MFIPSRLTLILFSCGLLFAQDAPKNRLLVLCKGDNSLAVVDVSSGRVIGRMMTGPDPHEVVASPDGKFAYVTNYGGGAFNTIAILDLVEFKPLPALDLGALRGPHGLVYEGGKVWFTAEAAKAVGRFDPAMRRIDWIMGTGQDRTHMLFVAPDENKVYTTNVSSATVSILEKRASTAPGPGGPPRAGGPPAGAPPPGGPRIDWEETVIPVGKGAEGFDVSPDGKQLWAANAWDGTISVIDLAAEKVIDTLQADVTGANRLKFTLDGKHVLVSSLSGPELVVLDANTRQVIKRIKIGHGAAGIQMEPDGAHAYVACTPDNYVAVIDLASLEMTRHIDAGTRPDGLAWTVSR